jgi:hypothetical protein
MQVPANSNGLHPQEMDCEMGWLNVGVGGAWILPSIGVHQGVCAPSRHLFVAVAAVAYA